MEYVIFRYMGMDLFQCAFLFCVRTGVRVMDDS